MPGFEDGFLGVPERPDKPRSTGLTHVIDKGLNLREIEGLFDTAGAFVDIVKLGWGTGYVTNNLEKKIALYRHFETPVVCGGTFFEAVYARDKLDEFKALADRVPLLARRDLRRHDRDPARPQARADRRLRARLHRALRGRLEGRRGEHRAVPLGRSGCRRSSTPARGGSSPRAARAALRASTDRAASFAPGSSTRSSTPSPSSRLIWEAPTKESQAWFIKHFGTNVNLGNIPPDEVIPLETLRLGLRGDTLKEVLLGGEPAAAG